MSTFIVANLGDAALNVSTTVLSISGTVDNVGLCFIQNGTAAPLTITVTAGLSWVIVKDALGNSNTYPITLVASDGSTFDGAPNYIIAVPYAWVGLSYNGSGFSIVG